MLGFLGLYPDIQDELVEQITEVVGLKCEPVHCSVRSFLTGLLMFSIVV